jgi:CIC family chloride channel protein
VIAASLVSSTIVRELFGYSFSTWRLHLRGEAVKSARDVGWVRTLTAGGMMRRETGATLATIPIAEFRRRFPLGATSRVVLIDGEGHYAGIAVPAAAFMEGLDPEDPIGSVAVAKEDALRPEMDVLEVMRSFDRTGSDELAVLTADGRVLGLLSENHVRRRYAEEMEKAQRALFGEI